MDNRKRRFRPKDSLARLAKVRLVLDLTVADLVVLNEICKQSDLVDGPMESEVKRKIFEAVGLVGSQFNPLRRADEKKVALGFRI